MQVQASLFERPAATVAAPVKKPRPYQAAADAGIWEQLAKHRSTLVALFTGGGKTFIAGQAALKAPGRVLFLAHLDTLVSQSKIELEAITGAPWEREQAGDYALTRGSNNVVASIQSLMNPIRHQRFTPDAFALIIVDEAHHYVSAAYKRVLDYFTGAKVIGLTATPDRKDRKALGRILESVAFKMDLVDGIDDGWSVPIDCRPPIELDVNLDDIKVRDGDFVEADLEEKIKEVVGPIVTAGMKHAGDMRTIIFTPRVESAHAAARALNNLRPGCAQAIDGGMDRDVKRRIIASHKRGEFQFLANCGVLVEGYDDKAVMCMIDAAPTKSRARCAQKVGRLLRPLANVDAWETAEERRAAIAASEKHHAIWIDLKFNGKKHELATPLQLLAGNYTDKERAVAKKMLEKTGGDVKAMLEKARAKLAATANRAKVKMELGSYDPTKRKRGTVAPTAQPSAGQVRQLIRFGIPVSAAKTAWEAQKLIGYEFVAEKNRWCNYTQRMWLQARGVSGRGMPAEKGRLLARYWQSAGKPPQLTRSMIDQALARPEPGSDG